MSASSLRSAILLLALLAGANASAGLLRDDPPAGPPADESAVALPPAPDKNHLLRYDVSAASSMSFAIDAKSISIADSTIVRFTSVITSPTGVTNTSYEGVNCKTAERKLYASGRPDGSWNAFPEAVWKPVSVGGTNNYQAALMRDFFCDGDMVAGKVPAIVDRIKRKKPIR